MLPQEGRVLDLSCGDGLFFELVHRLYPKLNLTGVDSSVEEINKAQAQYTWAWFLVSNVEQISLPKHCFDVIFCNTSFHHFKDPLKMLSEAKRVLKNNGVIYIMDTLPKNRLSQILYNWRGCPAPYHFEKYYTLPEIEKLVNVSGLKTVKELKISFFPRSLALEIRK